MDTGDGTDWASLNHAYGSAVDTPALLSALGSEDAAVRRAALEDLWSSLCHQGTVYPASRVAVPGLVGVLAADGYTETRVDVGVLVAAIGSAWTGAEPGSPDHRIALACRDAVADQRAVLGSTFTTAPRRVRISMLAVAAGVIGVAPEVALALVPRLAGDDDLRVRAACGLMVLLAGSSAELTLERVQAAAATDEDTADFAAHVEDDDPTTLAVDVCFELCCRALGSPSAP